MKRTCRVIAVCAVTLLSSIDNLSANEAEDYASTEFGKVEYRIPRRYRPGVQHPKMPDGYAAFQLMLNLRDMSPFGSEINYSHGWGDRLQVLAEYKVDLIPYDKFVIDLFSWSHTTVLDTVDVIAGCKHYKGNFTVATDLVLCENNARKYVALCGSVIPVAFPSCNVSTPIHDGSVVTYTYGTNHMNDTFNIDKRLHSFIEQIEQK